PAASRPRPKSPWVAPRSRRAVGRGSLRTGGAPFAPQSEEDRMRKWILGGLLLGTLGAAPAFANTNVGLSILIGNAPPPPRVVYVEQSHWTYIPEERMYVVDDEDLPYDYFRYGTYFYIY